MNELIFKKSEKVKAIAWLDSMIDSLDDEKDYVIEVKQHKRKRSLSANAYFWTLCDQIAAHLGIAKEQIYRQYILNVGGNTEMLRVEDRAVQTLREIWESHGLGWQIETMPSGFEGWTDCIMYKGSSSFDTATMSRLINLAVQDAESYGIETLESAKIERLCAEWKGVE